VTTFSRAVRGKRAIHPAPLDRHSWSFHPLKTDCIYSLLQILECRTARARSSNVRRFDCAMLRATAGARRGITRTFGN
jgi:hypothetical protein